MKCRDERGQIVIPIFYHVDPSEVRKQKGEFGKAFAKQEQENITKARSWRKALVDASNLAGWEPKQIASGHESVGIKKIVEKILDKLFFINSKSDDDLVGMETRLQELKSRLETGSGGVRMVGIWGVGGSGKTTLASCVYTEISHQFEGHFIVDNIREESSIHGLKQLQKRFLSAVFKRKVEVQSVAEGKRKIKSMLCRISVLILLDDVDDLGQLEALAGSHNWFGGGSRIIITTRDEHLLRTHKVDMVLPVSLLSNDDAIRLLNKHAYQENKPIEDYETLSQRVVSYASGLPLALKVLGSFLYDKDKNEWMSTLARLEDIPETEIMDKLKISYDGLKPVEKELFLDIACFFREKTKDYAIEILDACGFHPRIGITVLIQKALITISNGKFDMHDLVQQLGQYIVRGEHPNNPEKQSRVWLSEDIEDMCSRDAIMETDNIKAIECSDHDCSSRFYKLVSNMKKLRLLSVRITDNEDVEEPTFLSNELRYLHWEVYPASPFPKSFQPTKLVVLKLCFSLQKELWKGYKYLPHLKELLLSDVYGLVKTPDFGGLPCLQKFTLQFCGLKEIHPSLGNHSNLVYVSIHQCNKLSKFPTIVQMKKLEHLEIWYCRALQEFPEIQTNMDSLVVLDLIHVGIKVIPSSVGEYCTNLISLHFCYCHDIKIIEGNFRALTHLQKFEFTSSTKLEKLPEDLFGENSCLEEISLPWMRQPFLPSGCLGFPFLPCFLRKLDLSYCGLENEKCPQILLPELPSSIAILIADFCDSLISIGDFHTECEWLCHVSFLKEMTTSPLVGVPGNEKLLGSMLKGKAIENHSFILKLAGVEIPKGFTPPLINGNKFTLQLSPNWYSDYSGFLICAVLTGSYTLPPKITMKHENRMDCQQDVVWEESVDDKITWVGYVSFGSLRHTAWWNPTSNMISFSMNIFSSAIPDDTSDSDNMSEYMQETCSGLGVKLLSRQSESGPVETTKSSEFLDKKDDYSHKLRIEYDLKSFLEIVF
ncbi:toll/interleukin-1 receptor (TIR) domain-containing protein [Artemisia annua]|uniref:Toll/interleukin-1 receptor (TIR) domain-containing protein n=1 Tax=Artemisia annua TaxID=35608 RepID=A0A2U1LVA5_ARTAN|nr:toll/interleukin-1 receptor (TIR) domain-containing protein [Artemisia annua]